MPYEQTITTYDYDNGDYNLRAELDVAEQDTSIEASVSVTLENYLVTLDTEGWITGLKETYSDNGEGYYLYISASDSDNENIHYSQYTEQLPGEFSKLDASVEITNRSLDDMKFNISGEFDWAEIEASNTSQDFFGWSVNLPDTTSQFVSPHIADSLGETVDSYSRSDFKMSGVTMNEYDKIDGYGEYISDFLTDSQKSNKAGSYIVKSKSLNQSKSKQIGGPAGQEDLFYPKMNKPQYPYHPTIMDREEIRR